VAVSPVVAFGRNKPFFIVGIFGRAMVVKRPEAGDDFGLTSGRKIPEIGRNVPKSKPADRNRFPGGCEAGFARKGP
jgi:hypothetical protein